MTTFCIKGGRIIDPANGRDEIADLWISDGKIRTSAPEGEIETTIDASGRIVVPGLIDMHVHLREPGREDQ